MTSAYEEIAALFETAGEESYGEGVTQRAHALQCAALASHEDAPDALVAAALLHDVGHLLEPSDDAYGYHKHDRAGAAWLERRFGPEVTEPVRLHVAAKRYLCLYEPGYLKTLSPSSAYTLGKQGGPMRPEEAQAFEKEPFFAEALRLRRWDEAGKVEGLPVPELAAYRELLNGLAKTG